MYLKIKFINEYYKIIRDKVGKELMLQNRQRGYDWLMAQTEPIGPSSNNNKSFANLNQSSFLLVIQMSLSFLLAFII